MISEPPEQLAPQISAEQLRSLSLAERRVLVERIRIFYPRWQQILEQIRYCHQMAEVAADPPCLLLVGPSGAGKSTLVEGYVNQYPPSVTPTNTYYDALYVVIPSKATERNLSMAILKALGDPRYDKGTIGNMQIRVVNFLRDCQVKLLVLDELQHFFDRNSQKVLQDVSNWIKTVIKDRDLCIGCVLVGLENESEKVVNVNPQLARLFGDPYRLAPFQWKETDPDTIQEFRTFLTEVEKRLPLVEASKSNLTNKERAWRCFVASSGITGHLMKLIRKATQNALTCRQEHLDDKLLAEAFTQELGGERRNISNPFIGDPPSTCPQPKPPEAGARATNRRSQSRKEEKETMQDVLNK